jgi:tRNA (guanine-N7-)-methyltransferase
MDIVNAHEQVGRAAGNSRPVSSRQREVHPRLVAALDAHVSQAWRAPLHPPTVEAFEALQRLTGQTAADLVLDAGCGTGESTRQIARALPECLVIGVDKSADRLRRGGILRYPHREGNAIWLRADLATFWRLALEAGWRLRRHYLLYPNPWPKPAHLRRRWHAHPVFPHLLRLGGVLEMRSNWRVYAQEFAVAVNRVLGAGARPSALGDTLVTSPFERKYRASGHPLYSVSVSCDSSAVNRSTPVRLL